MQREQKKRKVVDISTKLAIVKHLDQGNSIRSTAEKFGVSKGTVQAAKASRDGLLQEAESNRSLSKARIVKQSDINVILWRWFYTARARGYPISGPILQEKAKQIAGELGIEATDFTASEGWLQKWKQRNNVRSYKVSGESGHVDLERAGQWKSCLESMLTGYDLKNVFNMDETGFFFRALPDSTLSHIKDSCKGGKQGKDRVTVALTCSAMGEKLPPWIIGKSKNPRSFRGQDMTKFKIKYAHRKAWMTNPIFNQYLKDLDEHFKRNGRKILLFVDNAPVHIVDEKTVLTNLEVRFFPPNLTSVLQPLDAGIIRSLKALARKFEVLSILGNIDDNVFVHASEFAKKLTVLDAIKFIDKSWSLVTKETVMKCFALCGFIVNDRGDNDVNDIVAQEDEMASLASRLGIERDQLVLEEHLPEFEVVEEQNLIRQLVQEHTDQNDDDEPEDIIMEYTPAEEQPVITISQAKSMVTDLIAFTKKHSLFSEELDLLNLSATVKQLYNASLKQATIQQFFH